MPALDCTDIKALLSALIDDQLDPHTRHQVERHLAQCESCCAQINEHERLDALVSMSSEVALHMQPDLPAGFADEVLARTVRAREPQSAWLRNLVTWTGWCAAAASIALASLIWVMDQRSIGLPQSAQVISPRQDAIAMTDEMSNRNARFAAYTTGANLQSSVFDGPFESAEELLIDRAAPLLGSPVYAEPLTGFDDDAFALAPSSVHDRASAVDAAPGQPVLTISRAEADALYNVSLLMGILEDVDLASFSEIEQVRQVALVENLVERLAEARDGVVPSDRPALLAAEAVLVRLIEGPLDHADVRHLRETVGRLDLARSIGGITKRWDQAHALEL